MPSQKRERKRAGRDARREAAREAQRRAARRRQLTGAGVLILVIALIGFLVSRGGDDEQDVAAGDTTTTTAEGVDESTLPCPPTDGSVPEPIKKFDGQPKLCINVTKLYKAAVETDIGTFTIELDAAKAPSTANNFVWLARYRTYEGAPFHRVIPGFVVQGGDVATGTGSGDAGYKFPDELPEAGQYQLGSVAMANSGPDTNGSQIFVVTGPQGVALPPNYSLFGKVTSGFEEVVKKIEADGSPSGTPKVFHKILKVTITETES